MFERFTQASRVIVVQAQEEARAARDERVGTQHLLLSMLHEEGGDVARRLAGQGVDRAAVQAALDRFLQAGAGPELDADALDSIGIDLDAVREKVEATFGPGALDRPGRGGSPGRGHIPFTPRAKKVLELGLREALALHSKEIRPDHLLLGLLREGEGLGAKALFDAGVDLRLLADQMRTELRAGS